MANNVDDLFDCFSDISPKENNQNELLIKDEKKETQPLGRECFEEEKQKLEQFSYNLDYQINLKEEEELIQEKTRKELYNELNNLEGATEFLNNKVRKVGENEQSNNRINDKKIEEVVIANSKTINNEDVLVLEDFGTETNCIHKCVKPKSYVHKELDPLLEPARTYKFSLDTFQKKSIECLERNESVLVSAHTSAGKTVIAEYAIALGLRDKQRVIYTSPIKALSNQKYRDLSEEFKEVGLITGDISINPDAPIIVMTTEILRSMLYRGSSLTKEVKWVIFDEIHYMRDRERGVIWEETIILLPLMVRFIFLSATIPNGIQFAEWVSSIKNQACHIIYTDYRPTPLQHYIYPTGSESVFLICDENKEFKKDNFMKAVNVINEKNNLNEKFGNMTSKQLKRTKGNTVDIEKIVQMCHSRKYTPLIIFAFSKRECEVNAMGIQKIDLTDESEKTIIKDLYEKAIQILADDDRELPQVQFILPLLLRGIGIHHGGLLPIIKEIIEIMFQESLLKVLFSTETFSMGINMPAKTVVFTSLTKFDGLEKRLITSGEYIQMAGRAGRRGLDDRGIVIIMLDTALDWKEAQALFMGEANRLDSQFHLGYNMVLNLLRIEGITPEFMIERSFIQYQTNKNLHKKTMLKQRAQQRIKEIHSYLSDLYIDEQMKEVSKEEMIQKIKKKNNLSITDEGNEELIEKELMQYPTVMKSISNYYMSRHKLVDLGESLRSIMTKKKNITPYLVKGRLLYIAEKQLRWGWCICIEARVVRKEHQSVAHNSYDHRYHDSLKTSQKKEILLVDCIVPYTINRKRKIEEVANSTKAEKRKLREDAEREKHYKELGISRMEGEHDCIPAGNVADAKWKLMSFFIENVYQLSAVVLNLPNCFNHTNNEDVELVKMKYNTMINCLGSEDKIPIIYPAKMNIQDPNFFKILKDIQMYEEILQKNQLINNPQLETYYQMYSQYFFLQSEKNNFERGIEKYKDIVLKKELRDMLNLLESLKYIEITYNLGTIKNDDSKNEGIKQEEEKEETEPKNEQEEKNDPKESSKYSPLMTMIDANTKSTKYEDKNYIVTMKGQIASAILSVDELVIAELFFSNFFSSYDYDYICAFLSCFVYDESSAKDPAVNDPILNEGYEKITQVVNLIATKMKQCGMKINVKDYLEKFKCAIMPIVLSWVRGHSFTEILSDSLIYEGAIIRTLRRLDELLRQMICAFRGINNEAMVEILLKASSKLRRGLPFAPSLYI